ncbi:DUF6463 family protein [Streptomyces sp. NPDC052773]|uniref:DUF6463 family protein n=1 Tax=Streptomyces sp. NPDC052773 TaxID=3365693 RepID=UPI0037CFB823
MNTAAPEQAPKSRAHGLRLWIPRLLGAAAVAHILVGVTAACPHWTGIVSEGVWNTVGNDDEGRMMALWFMVGGIALVGFALLARRSVVTTGTLPAELGWILLALGAPVSLMEPVSGGWSLIVIGLLAVRVSRRDRSAAGRG